MKATNSQLSCYTIEATIGKGTFGKVKKAINNYTLEPVAIKILQKNKIKDVTDVERVSRELHILKLVRHSAIAQLYEVIETPDTIFMIMQYAQNGEFFDYIMEARVQNQREAHHYFAQIVSGLQYLHQLGVTHRDVKPENMLLDVHNRIKIVDFGLSNMYKKQQLLTTACGSPCYASPEMIRGELYDPELTDVWSLGIVLFTMMMAKLPFEDDNTSVLYSKIKSGIYLIDRKVSPQFKDLLSKLINIKPQNRLRLKGIKQHPWFTNFTQINSFGLNVGYDKIPIEDKIVKNMQNFGYAPALTKRYLQYNVKNECTTMYYLFLKKQFKLGFESKADICSGSFDQQLAKPRTRKKRPHSIDFTALVQKIQPRDEEVSSIKKLNRKCVSQIKRLQIEVRSLSRSSVQNQDWQMFSSNKNNPKKFNLYNLTAKIKSPLRLETSSHHQRKPKISKKSPQNENQLKIFVNKLVRENRRLQTEHVREIYTRGARENFNKGKAEVTEIFWKKKSASNTNKGLSKAIRGVSSKKGITTNVYH